ncbi:MAG: MBL fold metallo-hydrolase [Planctomycetota bacterium]|nr:MBL fold metallo-hydrolase [Planctomycetota bacterium]MDA0920671.1 MBL fold metallo-hydrolase [Planctomycetota bacterium]MDA1160600.1 MBL fold metallo-hydrolase [Planctomycetota bacterium]
MSDLTVRFWGTRGSIPTPGRKTKKYGGNTTCIEVRHEDTLLVFDAGSGIRELGMSWLNEFSGKPVDAAIVFTHLHWDHIQGFPFFSCGYMPQNSFTIWGEKRESAGVEQLLSGQMTGDYFPIELSAMQAKLKFKTVDGPFEVGKMKIRPFRLPHPGGSLGYRVEADGAVFVLATDSELDQIALNREELLSDHLAPRQYPDDLIEFMSGVNLIAIDTQYTDSVYPQRVGWGHNSIATVVDLCDQVKPDILAMCHHDPQSTDQMVSKMSDDAARRLKRLDSDTLFFAAREGLTIKSHRPKRPPSLN